jgi:hypothetical protein
VTFVMTAATSVAADLAVEKDKVTPGVLGLLIVVLLGVATWLLLRSMNKQLRKVDFEERDLRQDRRDGPGGGEGRPEPG